MTPVFQLGTEPGSPDRPNDQRPLRRVALRGTQIELEVFIHREDLDGLAPMLIVNSIEFPMPPSLEFCEQMRGAGYQTIFVRRPGFGKTPALPTILLSPKQVEARAPVATEAALLNLLIETLELKQVTLLGMGTSNPICLRLAQLSPEVSFTVFANPLFNPAIWDVIRPSWLRRMIRQTLQTRSGLTIALRGLKAILRRDPLWFYTQFAQKSEGDRAYIAANKTDFKTASLFLQRIEALTFFYDLQTALIEETNWERAAIQPLNAVIFSGVETTTKWKSAIVKEADRLRLPIRFADSGDLFVPYASPDQLLDAIKHYDVTRQHARID